MLRSMLATALYRAASTRLEIATSLSAKWLEINGLSRFLADHGITLVLDVGANEGQFVAKLRRLGYQGAIVSFEPDPRAFVQLSARYGGDPRWKGVPMALGESDGSMPFNLAHHSVLSSLLTSMRAENVSHTVDVDLRRLDTVWEQFVPAGARVLLKTDTQGYDLHVLRGAAGHLGDVTGILAELSVLPIYEHSPALPTALEAYRNAGFDIVDQFIVNRTPDGRVLEFDGLFVRRAAVAARSVNGPPANDRAP